MAEEKARAADWKNLAVLACTILVSLALCELAFRRMNGQPAFAWTNFRNTSVIRIQMSDGTRYDSNLGWAMIENKSRSGISVSTIDLGVRRNSAAHKLTRQGWNVAVGSSFAAGAEVRDEGAWPAQLEHLLGTPVDNGAVGGYAFDQVILRAEQLLEVLKPRLLIVEAMNESIDWVGYSSMVASKPYFTLVDGKLARHNNPVPIITRDGDRLDPIKTALGYSLMIDRAMATVFPDAWYASNTRSVRRIANDAVGVSWEG